VTGFPQGAVKGAVFGGKSGQGEEGRARGRAQRAGRVGAGEPRARCRQRVNMRLAHLRVAIASYQPPRLGVGEDEKNVGLHRGMKIKKRNFNLTMPPEHGEAQLPNSTTLFRAGDAALSSGSQGD
jgi:hypothetical protein